MIVDSNRGVAIFAGEDGFVEDVQLHGLLLSTRIHAGQWWGKGEPMVVCAHDGGRIAGIDVLGVSSLADNSAFLCSKGGSLKDIAIEAWTARIVDSKNLRRFGDRWDLQPIGFHPVPFPTDQRPWLVAEGVEGLRVHRCMARGEPPLSDGAVRALLRESRLELS
jgi:hypothetical protein